MKGYQIMKTEESVHHISSDSKLQGYRTAEFIRCTKRWPVVFVYIIISKWLCKFCGYANAISQFFCQKCWSWGYLHPFSLANNHVQDGNQKVYKVVCCFYSWVPQTMSSSSLHCYRGHSLFTSYHQIVHILLHYTVLYTKAHQCEEEFGWAVVGVVCIAGLKMTHKP